MEIIDRIRETETADAYLLTSVENVAYATGFTGDSSQLLISAYGEYFFTDSRYEELARNEISPSIEIISTGGANRVLAIASKLRDCRRLGIEKQDVTIGVFEAYRDAFNEVEYIDLSQFLLTMRMIKSENEIEKIRKAARANEIALEETLPLIKPGISELDIRAELEYRMKKQGMDLAFSTIAAAGMNSAIPHATPSSYKICDGDFLTLDFGCRFEGYCSDITRTFGVGNIDGQRKKIYDIVKEAQQSAADAAQVGADTREIDFIARDLIHKNGYGAYYDHGTGHGVGRQIHELPILNPRFSYILEKNMVFTVEPGIYVPGIGGVRIEDTLVAGFGSVYTFSKELILL
ncbi:MAG: Xaa-Pro peptidase family protein [Christensenella sp.]|nr:Xaa-Pro peptidase family protein [Christensenella sp.]